MKNKTKIGCKWSIYDFLLLSLLITAKSDGSVLVNLGLLIPLRQFSVTSRERLLCSCVDLTVCCSAVQLEIQTTRPFSGPNPISCSYASCNDANQSLFLLHRLLSFASFSHHLDHLGLAYIIEICTSIIPLKQYSSTSFIQVKKVGMRPQLQLWKSV